MECNLSVGKVDQVGVGGTDLIYSSWVHLSSQLGTNLLERGWTLFLSGALGERCQAGMGVVIATFFSASTLGFTPVNERVTCLQLAYGDRL